MPQQLLTAVTFRSFVKLQAIIHAKGRLAKLCGCWVQGSNSVAFNGRQGRHGSDRLNEAIPHFMLRGKAIHPMVTWLLARSSRGSCHGPGPLKHLGYLLNKGSGQERERERERKRFTSFPATPGRCRMPVG